MKELDFLDTAVALAKRTTLLEWFAVLASIAYVLLATFQKRSCWYFAGISSCIYTYLCFSGKLYVESVLNIFYVVMAIIGWLSWKTKAAATDISSAGEHVMRWKPKNHIVLIVLCTTCGLLTGNVLDSYTDQAFPYIDSVSFYLCLAATWMVTKKLLENWLYFVVIDAVSIFMYYSRGLALSSLLYALFSILAVIGFVRWLRIYRLHYQA